LFVDSICSLLRLFYGLFILSVFAFMMRIKRKAKIKLKASCNDESCKSDEFTDATYMAIITIKLYDQFIQQETRREHINKGRNRFNSPLNKRFIYYATNNITGT
jgi:hypothetical protein